MTDETGELVPFAREHLDETVGLFAAEGWETYTEDAERTFRALTAAGSTTMVAIAEGAVAGVIQIQSDGEIEATIALLLIGAQWRGRGFGRSLIRVAFERAGGMRLGVLTKSGDYYESLGAAAVPGFRLRPEDLGGA